MYIVVRGEFGIYRKPAKPSSSPTRAPSGFDSTAGRQTSSPLHGAWLRVLKAPDFVGEELLAGGLVLTETVVCETAGLMLRVAGHDFRYCGNSHHQLA